MKAVIFAGGVGTRLWPLSRKKSPKQFEKIIGDHSTLQIAVDILTSVISPKDIFIATGKDYLPIVREQLKQIPAENLIGEPYRKDNGPAVALMMGQLNKKFPQEAVVVIWSDYLIKNVEKLKTILKASEELLKENGQKIIYFGQKPRFASTNLGWIETGETLKDIKGIEFKKFIGWKYRPEEKLAKKYFSNESYCWNTGIFATTPHFMYGLFKHYTPKIYRYIEEIWEHEGKEDFDEVFDRNYSQLQSITLDNAISEQIDSDVAYVISENIEWSDVGAWEALKEALENKTEDNITKGKVLLEDSLDNLVYNYEEQKVTVGIDLNDLLVVNTEDVLLVARKSSVSKIKKLVESFQGTENEGLT